MYNRDEGQPQQPQTSSFIVAQAPQQPLLQGQSQPSYQTTNTGANMTNSGHTSVYLGEPRFNGFDHKTIRNQFVSKVYSILSVQLFFTVIVIGWFTLHKPTQEYFAHQSGQYWLYGAFAVALVVLFILICVESARRSFPLNFILLSLLTLAYSLIAGISSARYETITVMAAFLTTAFATVVIILLAKYSPFDMTTCGCGLCILALIHLVATLLLTVILVPMGYGHTASMLIAGTGAFLVSLYLMYDLQLIMGGRSAELSPEEYILAAVLLYIDIIQLFQYILILFGNRN